MTFDFHPEAETEFLEAIAYYESRAPLYSIESDRVYILAVMHLHRHPDYWKSRR